MTTTTNLDTDAIARAGLFDAEHHGIVANEPESAARGTMDVHAEKEFHDITASSTGDDDDYPDKPTSEELKTLRRVSGKIMWGMWTIAFVELCERFSYYGSSVLYTNFVNHPLPAGSNTGAPPGGDGLPGAVGLGPKAAQGISLFNQFFAYVMPLLG